MNEKRFRIPYRVRVRLRNFGLAALMVFSPLIALELILQIFDPWGIRFYDDIALFRVAIEDDALRGFILPDGVHQYSHWAATLENGARRVPNTPTSADCQIVILGDSFAFAYGVNDEQSWLNHLAADFPEIQFVNAGLTAYNSANVLGSWQAFPGATHYIYLSNANDWEPPITELPIAYRPGDASTLMPFIARYGNYLYNRSRALSEIIEGTGGEQLAIPKYQRYFEDMQTLDAVENLSIITWEDNFLRPALDSLGIDYQTTASFRGYEISSIDGHYNVEGNRVFAENLKPLFEGILSEACS